MTSAPEFARRILKLELPSLLSPRSAASWSHGRHYSISGKSLPESDVTRLFTPVTIGGVAVDLMSSENAIAVIVGHALKAERKTLAVLSANLDHVQHFGAQGFWEQALKCEESVEWLTLLDGAPLVTQANKLTGRQWPRLAGSDIIESILDRCALEGLRVGFLGGTCETQRLVREKFAIERPDLQIVGWWAPQRESLEDSDSSRELCARIKEAEADVLVVCLGKPRQELWIAEYGAQTGAKALLAFGAAVDFLAGRVRRAPDSVKKLGMEWAWRLAMEPRRLAKRYLLNGPGSYMSVRRDSFIGLPPTPSRLQHSGLPTYTSSRSSAGLQPGRFSPLGAHTDVAVLIVTYNNQHDIGRLLQSLRRETADQSIKVVIADNSASRETLDTLVSEVDVHSFSTGGNRGYSGGLNLAAKSAGTADSFLILNPDIWLERGSIKALRDRMRSSAAGIVVPRLLNGDGTTYLSLRREPSLLRSLGDACLGSKLPGRPGWLSEMDYNSESYAYPHPAEWATGAALLVSSETAESVGGWDERFFLYSEETDFFRRARQAGASVWFEPRARMKHQGGASGSSPDLSALMAVNRIRYSRKHGTSLEAVLVHCTVAVGELLRAGKPERRLALATVIGLHRWERLPHATCYERAAERSAQPSGCVIIPAHNEAAVLGRTLRSLVPLLESGNVEVIVACNGCTDGTEQIAASVPGVRVISMPGASKTEALNSADCAATKWPRIYLDADIELSPESVAQTLGALSEEGGPLAARPPFQYDTTSATWPVRAYYRARTRISLSSSALWGAGVYGINEFGHRRFERFPGFVGDDYFVDRVFTKEEKKVLECDPASVRTPRSTSALLGTLKRVYRGNAEQDCGARSTAARTLLALLCSIHGPFSAIDAAIYVTFALCGRNRGRRAAGDTWERDESSRQLPGPQPVEERMKPMEVAD